MTRLSGGGLSNEVKQSRQLQMMLAALPLAMIPARL